MKVVILAYSLILPFSRRFYEWGQHAYDSLCHTGQELVNSWPGVRFPATLSCRAGAVVWLLHLCISMSAMVRQTSLGRRQDSIQYNYWIVLRVMGFHQVQVWVSAVTRPTPGLTILYCSVLLCKTSSGYYGISCNNKSQWDFLAAHRDTGTAINVLGTTLLGK